MFWSFQTSVMRDEQRSALLLFNAIVVQLQKGIELSISFIALELTESFVDVAADATQRQNSQIIKPQYKYHHTEKHQKSILIHKKLSLSIVALIFGILKKVERK